MASLSVSRLLSRRVITTERVTGRRGYLVNKGCNSNHSNSRANPNQGLFGSTAPLLLALTLPWKKKTEEEEETVKAVRSKPKDQEVLDRADQLYEDNKAEELFELLVEFKDSDNPEILWRLARAHREIVKSNPKTPSDAAQQLFLQGLRCAERGLSHGEGNWACHKWYAIMLSEVGEYEGYKNKIENSYKIRNHFDIACKLKPRDPTVHHLLGRWHFQVASMNWIQKRIASTIFAKVPESSFEEALENFLRAEEVQPNFYSMNLLHLGLCYKELGNDRLALLHLTRLVESYEVKKEEDKEAVVEAEKLIKKITKK